MKQTKAPLLILFLFCACPAMAQKDSMQRIESVINNHLQNISRLSGNWENDDSLVYWNNSLTRYLTKNLQDNPRSLAYNFKNITECCLFITSSADGKLRYYGWNTQTGGSMRSYNTLAQYQTPTRVKVVVLNDACDTNNTDENYNPGVVYDTIYTIKTKTNKTIYITESTAILSTSLRVKYIESRILDKDSIMPYKLFKTKKGQLESISFEYNFFTYSDDKTELPINPFRIIKNTLYIPIVYEDSVTSKSLVYVFDGEQFVYKYNTK